MNTEEAIAGAVVLGGYYLAAKAMVKVKHAVKGAPRTKSDPLDDVLFTWPSGDPFTVRDILRSVQVKGITGSGKSSGSLLHFTRAIVRHPRSTCFIVAQKPEDKEFFQRIFNEYNKPLVVIEEGSKWRGNLLNTEMKAGADTRGLVEFLMTLGEVLDNGHARTSDPFWKKLEERILFGAVEALRQGNGKVDAPSLLEFITTAAYSPKELADPAWQAKFHNQTMARAFQKNKTRIEAADFSLLKSLWTGEFPSMDDKPRSSGLAGVMNLLSTFNTGLVWDMCSTETNIDPSVMDQGVSVLVNFPSSQYGASGQFISAGFRYLWQRAILRRKWNPSGHFNVMILDEFQESITSLDPRYLSQCRSHGGCMFTLTQTINSELSAMDSHHHKAKQLLSNFGLHIFHASDPETARFASELLGQQIDVLDSFQPGQPRDLTEQIFGNNQVSVSTSESWQPILQPSAMANLKTGGKANNNQVEAICIKLGEPWARIGRNWQKVSFDQRE